MATIADMVPTTAPMISDVESSFLGSLVPAAGAVEDDCVVEATVELEVEKKINVGPVSTVDDGLIIIGLDDATGVPDVPSVVAVVVVVVVVGVVV